MNNSSAVILDLIVVGIIVFVTVLAAKRGFVRTIVEVVGFVAAAVIAVSLGSAAAGMAYDNFLGPKLVTVTGDTASATTQEMVDKAWEALPDFIADNAEKLGVSKDKLNESISNVGGEDREEVIEKALQETVRPVFVRVIGMLCSTLFFIILAFVVKLLAKLLNGVFSFSVVGSLNRTLGGIIGLFKGAVFAVIFCMLVGMIASFTGGFWVFTEEALESSTVARFLLSVTPFSI